MKKVVICVLLFVFGFGNPCESGEIDRLNIIFEKDSVYQYLMVSQKDNIRVLHSGSISHKESAMDCQEPNRHVFEYTRIMMAGFAFHPETPEKVLFVGMGGATLPMYVRHYYPDLLITIVELDGEVCKIAQDYFHFREDENMEVVIMDGRRFLKRDRNRYDIIFLDAYLGETIPFHLTTLEFLELVKDHLTDEGVVVANTKSSSMFADSEIKTYTKVFGRVEIMERARGLVIFSYKLSDSEKRGSRWLKGKMEKVQIEKGFTDIHLGDLFQKHYTPEPCWNKDVPILTDDYAPVNYLIHQK